MLLDGDMRIEPVDRRRGAVDFGRADIRRGVDHLPLQIRQRHHVVVDDAERADAGGGEIEQHRRAKPAGADDQHAGAAERGLSRAAHLAQHDVARITFEFVGTQHDANIGRNRTPHDPCSQARPAIGLRRSFGYALPGGSGAGMNARIARALPSAC